MKIWKVYNEKNIVTESGAKTDAINALLEANGNGTESYYTDEAEARKAYEAITIDAKARKLGSHHFWSEGKFLEFGVVAEKDFAEAEGNLRDAFDAAVLWDFVEADASEGDEE